MADRFHFLESRAERDALFVLEKLFVSKRRSVVRLPDGDEVGMMFFGRSEVEADQICLRICETAGTSLGEVLRARSPRFADGIVNYAGYGGLAPT